MLLEKNLKKVLNILENKNPFGEKVELVGAIKTVDTDTINLSIQKGVKIVAENKVQEFLEKNDKIIGAKRHFIGHLQTNKVKYIVGKVDLIHSVDSLHLATAISNFALKNNLVQDILVEINIGNESTKSGLNPSEALKEIQEIKKLPAIKVKGLMCMLPPDIDLAKQKKIVL